MRAIKTTIPFIILMLFISSLSGQEQFIELQWKGAEKVKIGDSIEFHRLTFDHAEYPDAFSTTPFLQKVLDVPPGKVITDVQVKDPVFLPLSFTEQQLIDTAHITAELSPEVTHMKQREDIKAVFSLHPFKKSAAGYQKLTAFTMTYSLKDDKSHKAARMVQNSVLNSGEWYKIRIGEDGVYKISYNMMKNWGVNMSSLNINKLGVFGNTGRLLPEMNNVPRPEDLTENHVIIEDHGDGSFDQGDYIIFYGKSPIEWDYNSLQIKFNHKANPYTNHSYYFFTPDRGTAKNVEALPQAGVTPDEIVNTYDNYQYYENNKTSLIKSGREWFGEQLNIGRREFAVPQFTFDNVVEGSRLYLQTDFAVKATVPSEIEVRVNGTKVYNHSVLGLQVSDFQYGRQNSHRSKFDAAGNTYNVALEYNVPTSSAKAWLNWVELSARSYLNFTGEQLHFRDAESAGQGKYARFEVSGTDADTRIWEVTDPLHPRQVEATTQGNQKEFVLSVDEIREFVAFNGSDLKTPEFEEAVDNQNLHAVKNIDYLIITHPDYYDQAQRIAEFHQEHDNLSYYITFPEKIYNEFSSGGQDVTGIRDFVRHIYFNSNQSRRPQYLLLFGNGSYDYHDRVDNNTNFVPAFPSYESLNISYSYVTDDYFGLLDDSEGLQSPSGDNLIGFLDMGIGRFPADTRQQAEMYVDKVIHYATNPETHGSWRNDICIIADDEDNNTHLVQAEQLANIVDTSHKQFNLHKLYLDAYQQVRTPGGQRYPDVNDAIKARMESGVLIMNYTGHGGEVSLAHERIIGIQDIEGWSNYQALPLFITATCEFSRFDDPGIVSAGEKTLLNPGGGSIALLTTTRLAFSHTNSILNVRVFKKAFQRDEQGNYPRLGDLMIASKTPNNNKLYNFVLLGDPALRLAYPENKVVTTKINGNPADNTPDTLKALSEVTIEGQVQSMDGARMTQFNGEVYPVIFDKRYTAQTLGNDASSQVTSFEMQNKVLYKGKSTVENGAFSFTFLVPKDIDYSFGNGKLSYYAASQETDAGGYFNDVIIGGTAEQQGADNEGPEITLYMNDREFEEGDVVNETPMLIADLYDESGMNTVGNGIGHDLLAMMNKNTDNVIVLNDFYSAGLDTYKSGTVNYPFNTLPVGKHTITVKAWDIHNNSSEKTIEFIVSDNITPEITRMVGVPNPFSTSTAIHIEHNLFNERMTLTVQIYDISGRLIRSLGLFDKQSDGYKIPPIIWDGEDANGNRADKGLYVYSVLVVSKNKLVSKTGGKLIKTD